MTSNVDRKRAARLVQRFRSSNHIEGSVPMGASLMIGPLSYNWFQAMANRFHPHELKEHAVIGCISNGQPFSWPFDTPEGRLFHVPSARVRTNDAASIRVGVKAGLGIGFGPSWLFEDELRSGDVIQILAKHSLATFPIHAIRPVGRRPSSKVTAFIDFVAELLANEPHAGVPLAKRVRALA
jgi:DNA-binding transcriptional LysR family regulator